MRTAAHGDIEICYETFGDRRRPPLLLVMGLGAQMIAWPDDWCAAVADAGRFVIRFDNRDCGLSTKLHGVRVDLAAVLAAWEGQGTMPPVPYLLSDMADDAMAVLDDLGIERAHIVGASLASGIRRSALRQLSLLRSCRGCRGRRRCVRPRLLSRGRHAPDRRHPGLRLPR